MKIKNFGRNVAMEVANVHGPKSEAELLRVLDPNPDVKIRAIGRLHSWSEVIQSEGALIDVRRLDGVSLENFDGTASVRVGAGCQIKRVVETLQQHGLTLPTLGLIDEQTVAGAISTGTHGSGRQSLSHFVQAVRVASYCEDRREATLRTIDSSQPRMLRAIRCSLGCLGIITDVVLPVRPQYAIEEHLKRYDSLDQVLAKEADYPLGQFYLVPWRWDYFAQHRKESSRKRSWHAGLYRLFWSLGMDTAFHLVVCSLGRMLPAVCTPLAYRHLIPRLIPQNWRVVDRSDRQLTMQHERYRHIEVEIFVPHQHLEEAIGVAKKLLQSYASKPPGQRYVHHYPICIRRVLPDDSLVSPAAGGDKPWYTLSFISYAWPSKRNGFESFATEMVQLLAQRFGARPHWGKFCPVDADMIERLYPDWNEFSQLVRSAGDNYPFANRWLMRLLRRSPDERSVE